MGKIVLTKHIENKKNNLIPLTTKKMLIQKEIVFLFHEFRVPLL